MLPQIFSCGNPKWLFLPSPPSSFPSAKQDAARSSALEDGGIFCSKPTFLLSKNPRGRFTLVKLSSSRVTPGWLLFGALTAANAVSLCRGGILALNPPQNHQRSGCSVAYKQSQSKTTYPVSGVRSTAQGHRPEGLPSFWGDFGGPLQPREQRPAAGMGCDST